MKVAMVVPRRPDGGVRDELWRFCQRWWAERFPDWPIIEGRHDHGPFNRGVAINSAVPADVDVVLIVDGDVVAEPEQVEAAVQTAFDTGRLTLAYDSYAALDQRMTDQVLDGFAGNWKPGARLKMTTHVSSILAVPRPLWELTGGFDERCNGWGHDDTIFAHVCRVLGGGIERIPGTVWHLHHPHSPERSQKAPGLVASGALARRYFAENTPAGVGRILAERAIPDGVCLVVVTDGRRDCIDASLPAAWENLKGLPIVRTVICDDSADVDYQAWLRWRYPTTELVTTSRRSGFAGAVRRAWATALGSGQPWVFWLEDDFVIERPVDLSAIAQVLTGHPELTQMVLRRQAWFPGEVAAGGLIEEHPDAHTDRTDGTNEWVEHGLGHWTNPHLVSRAFLASHEWPTGNGSEAKFARTIRGRRSAYWGARTDAPLVEHRGVRHGTGY